MKILETTYGPISFRKCAGRGYAATLLQVRNQCGGKVCVRIAQTSAGSKWRWFASGPSTICGDNRESKAIFSTAHDAWLNFCEVQLPTYQRVDLSVSAVAGVALTYYHLENSK